MTVPPLGATEAWPADEPLVIGVSYPPAWFGDADGFAAAIARLAAVDPRLEVVVEPYEEGQELRTLRGSTRADEARSRVPALTDPQRALFDRAHVLVAIDLPFDVARLAPNLRWVQAVGAGIAQLQSAGLAGAGIRLTTSAGSNAVAIAEFAVGRLLEAWKDFPELARRQHGRQWQPRYGRELAGATVGLVGLGAINTAVARRLRAFDVDLLATRRSAAPAPDVDQVFAPEELFAMLARCDAVIAAVPETPATRGLMDARAFAAMPEGAWFCNVGRGTLVDERALVEALVSGRLGGAALDVQCHEPLPADDPLWSAPNLRLSYHCAAVPDRLFVNLHRLLEDNLVRFLAGEPLHNEVDPTAGY